MDRDREAVVRIIMLLVTLTLLLSLVSNIGATPPDAPDIRTFRPSQHGFKFRNAFKGSPLPASLDRLAAALGGAGGSRTLGVPDHYGLCGGMSAAAADFFLARHPISTARDVPAKGDDLYEEIYSRQIDSLGPGLQLATKFAEWMQLPDGTAFGTHARTLSVVSEVRRSIEHGEPVMLGLVLTSRKAKGKLWENHQVMAYSMRSEPTRVPTWSIFIYDPNFPEVDDARLDMRLTFEATLVGPSLPGVWSATPILGIETVRRASGKRDTVVRGVFVMPYEPKMPR